MKLFILASAIFSTSLIALVGNASADQVCGTLGSHAERPQCSPSMICPMIMKLQYDLKSADGAIYNLDTPDPETLLSLGSLNGSEVCVEGTKELGESVANSVTAE